MKKYILSILISFQFLLAYCQKHITLVYNGSDENIVKAVEKANDILNSKSFYDEIRKKTSFDNTKLSVQEIADRMEKANQDIKIVRRIKPVAIAGTTTNDKIKISRSLFGDDSTGNFSLSIAVNTLIHETVHAVDFLNLGNEFTHEGNSPIGQENTAPWVIGAIAQKMVEEKRF